MHARVWCVVWCVAVASAVSCPAGSYCSAGTGTCDTSLQKGYLYANSKVATYDLTTMAVTAYCTNNGGTCDVIPCTFLDMCITLNGDYMYVADARTKVMKLRLKGGVSSTLVASGNGMTAMRKVAVTADEKYLFYFDTNYMANRWIRHEIATGVDVNYADNMMYSDATDMVMLPDGVYVLFAKRYEIYKVSIEDPSSSTLVAGSAGCNPGVGTGAGFGSIRSMVISNSGTMVAISDSGCNKIFKLLLATMEVTVLYSSADLYATTSMAFGPGDAYIDFMMAYKLARLDMTTLQITTLPALTLDGQSLDTGSVLRGVAIFNGGPACSPPPPTPCVVGQYCPAGSSQPGVCPAGSFCSDPSTLTVCPATCQCPAGSTAPAACTELCPAGSYPGTVSQNVVVTDTKNGQYWLLYYNTTTHAVTTITSDSSRPCGTAYINGRSALTKDGSTLYFVAFDSYLSKLNMASIKFRLRSTADKNVSIKVRLILGRGKQDLELNTGFSINPKDWSESTDLPKQNNTENKVIFNNLKKLESFLFKSLNNDMGETIVIDSFWLNAKINDCFERVLKTDEGLITNYIQNIIDTADTRKVKVKGGYKHGLSLSRKNSYIATKNILKEYEAKVKKQIHFIDINQILIDKFENWLLKTKNYAINTSSKHIANIKTVCIEAENKGIQVNSYAKQITIATERHEEFFDTFDIVIAVLRG